MDKNTLTCRQQWLGKTSGVSEKERCQNARLFSKKDTKCAKKLCREGSLECLQCGASGDWTPSKLTCKPILCDDNKDAIKKAACESKSGKELTKCLANFDLLADPRLSGDNCFGNNKFQDICPISCSEGYVPKRAPFLCEADPLGNGLWLYEKGIDCQPIQCPIKIVSKDVAGNVQFADLDQNAYVVATTFNGKYLDQTIIEDKSCPRGRFRDQSSSNGTVCVPKAIYDSFTPAILKMTCTAPTMPETYVTAALLFSK